VYEVNDEHSMKELSWTNAGSSAETRCYSAFEQLLVKVFGKFTSIRLYNIVYMQYKAAICIEYMNGTVSN